MKTKLSKRNPKKFQSTKFSTFNNLNHPFVEEEAALADLQESSKKVNLENQENQENQEEEAEEGEVFVEADVVQMLNSTTVRKTFLL